MFCTLDFAPTSKHDPAGRRNTADCYVLNRVNERNLILKFIKIVFEGIEYIF